MEDSKLKQEFIDIILKALTKNEPQEESNNEFLLKSIVTLSGEIQSLVTAIESISNVIKHHNSAIEDLYTAQDIILRILKVDGQEDHSVAPAIPQKNKRNLN